MTEVPAAKPFVRSQLIGFHCFAPTYHTNHHLIFQHGAGLGSTNFYTPFNDHKTAIYLMGL